MMAELKDPREHVNEEPRNDLFDLGFGFGSFFAVLTIIFVGMIVAKALLS